MSDENMVPSDNTPNQSQKATPAAATTNGTLSTDTSTPQGPFTASLKRSYESPFARFVKEQQKKSRSDDLASTTSITPVSNGNMSHATQVSSSSDQIPSMAALRQQLEGHMSLLSNQLQLLVSGVPATSRTLSSPLTQIPLQPSTGINCPTRAPFLKPFILPKVHSSSSSALNGPAVTPLNTGQKRLFFQPSKTASSSGLVAYTLLPPGPVAPFSGSALETNSVQSESTSQGLSGFNKLLSVPSHQTGPLTTHPTVTTPISPLFVMSDSPNPPSIPSIARSNSCTSHSSPSASAVNTVSGAPTNNRIEQSQSSNTASSSGTSSTLQQTASASIQSPQIPSHSPPRNNTPPGAQVSNPSATPSSNPPAAPTSTLPNTNHNSALAESSSASNNTPTAPRPQITSSTPAIFNNSNSTSAPVNSNSPRPTMSSSSASASPAADNLASYQNYNLIHLLNLIYSNRCLVADLKEAARLIPGRSVTLKRDLQHKVDSYAREHPEMIPQLMRALCRRLEAKTPRFRDAFYAIPISDSYRDRLKAYYTEYMGERRISTTYTTPTVYRPPSQPVALPPPPAPVTDETLNKVQFKVSSMFRLDGRIGPIHYLDKTSLKNFSFVLDSKLIESLVATATDTQGKFNENKKGKRVFLTLCQLPQGYPFPKPKTEGGPIEVQMDSPYSFELTVNERGISTYSYYQQRRSPIDLTPYISLMGKTDIRVRLNNGYSVSAAQQRSWLIGLYHGQMLDTEDLLSELRNTKYQSKNEVVERMRQKAAKDDDDIAESGQVVTLRDAVSLLRIKHPLKAKNCFHMQPFDGDTFFMMNKGRAEDTWRCPKCNGVLRFDDLIYDGFFEDILKNVGEDIESVEVQPDGTWTAKVEEAVMIESDDDDNAVYASSSSSFVPPPGAQVIDLTLD